MMRADAGCQTTRACRLAMATAAGSKAAQTARDFEREDTRAEAREALAKIKEQGMEVNKVSPEEIQRMREQAKPAIQTVIDTVGEPLFNEVQAAVEKAPK